MRNAQLVVLLSAVVGCGGAQGDCPDCVCEVACPPAEATECPQVELSCPAPDPVDCPNCDVVCPEVAPTTLGTSGRTVFYRSFRDTRIWANGNPISQTECNATNWSDCCPAGFTAVGHFNSEYGEGHVICLEDLPASAG